MSDVRLVVFDLGRVLIRICDGWRHACELAGIAVPENVPDLDDAARQRVDQIIGRLDCGASDLESFAREYAPCCGLRPADVIRLQEAYLRGPYPGAVELIDELSLQGVQTACLSNTHDTHWQMMCDPAGANYLPLERLTHRFASHLLGLRKPDPAIYEYVERTTGVTPQGIVFFDDLEANVAAARSRGWRAHQVRIDEDPIAQVRCALRAAHILSSR